MFDSLSPSALPEAADAAVVGAVEGWARAEAAGAARWLAAIAELVERRCGPDDGDDDGGDGRRLWSCDWWDATAAEIGAALNISARRASSQIHRTGRSSSADRAAFSRAQATAFLEASTWVTWAPAAAQTRLATPV